MITVIYLPDIKTFSGLQMHTFRYAKWFADRFHPRRRWCKLAEAAQR